MARKAVKAKQPRRLIGLRSYVNSEEQKRIEQAADQYNLTVSAFIRTVCLDSKCWPTRSAKRLRALQEDSRQAQLL